MMMNKTVATLEGRSKPQHSLDTRYGEIGISALVAALRYQVSPTPKNPAYAEDTELRRNEAA